MTFKEKLAAVVLTLTGTPGFMPAEDLFHGNYRIEDQSFPVVMCLPNGLGNIDIKTQVLRTESISLFFSELIDMDVAYNVKEDCYERMHLLAAEFLVKVGLSIHFFAPTEIAWDYFEKFDVNICGVVYTMKLKERNGLNVCDLKI